MRTTIPLKVRPMLVSGQLAVDDKGPLILIDSEQPEREQVIALWHEALHLLGLTDEAQVEATANTLAAACPSILRKLAHNINVPDAAESLRPSLAEKRAAEIHANDCPHFQAFFAKHALSSKLAPSCLCCGAPVAREQWAITHAELPNIFICACCVEKVRTPSPVAVPEGWKLVPIEPTEAMQAEGHVKRIGHIDGRLPYAGTDEIYSAMIAAAPQPPSALPAERGTE